ncbi:MAG: DNA translocase FtsK [Lachnospiraceae bacterium]|nr:DNA translocase FtsK [Lachnospiraceae bacterium]
MEQKREVISLAGSNNNNRAKQSNRRTSQSSGKSNTSSSRTRGTMKKAVSEERESTLGAEIKVWIIGAVMLILELGNFGVCGFFNYVSKFLFGLFGVVQYALPLAVLFAVFFLHVNEYKKRAVEKVVIGSLVLLCFGMIGQLVAGVEEYKFTRIFMQGFEDQLGGGILCGSFTYLLHAMVGEVGTYIIIILAVIICIVMFAEFSVIGFIKGTVKDISELNHGDDAFEDEVANERKCLGAKKKNKDFEEIVKEDYPGDRDDVFTERKKASILDSISVLPADSDQGILPSKKVDKLPLNEEVHEITMDYDINLPGENMDHFFVSETDKDVFKEEAKKKGRKTKVKPNIVPAVLPGETANAGELKAVASNTNVSLGDSEQTITDLKMENKTVAAVKTMSAKEVRKSDAEYRYPPLELLQRGKASAATKEETIRQNAIKLQEVLKSFGVNVTMTNYSCGPSVTRYEMVPEQGVKVSKITGLADDIMMNLAAQSIRIEAPIPGKSAVGIEIPNGSRSGVGFRELIDTDKFIKHPSKISFAVGKDIEGNVVVEDIAKMPHLLIAGATGSGKSVCTNTLIMSILYKARPDEVKLILIDPKQVELKVYNGIPHLLTPVVTDPKKAAGALNWAVAEMTKRYQMFSECNVRNIQGYNEKVQDLQSSGAVEEEKLEKMPQIVIIVDELADLMMVAKGEVEEAIVRLAQLARAAGIHLVIATQRPSVDVVTGLIKANVPSRIALSVSSGVDSRTIIDSVGAEKLLGNGDMLFYPTMYPKPVRVQGAYISDDEVVNVVEYLKAQNGESSYSEEVTSQISSASSNSGATTIGDGGSTNDKDEYFVQAGRFIIEKDKASIGMLQRMFKIGFNRAARIMDQLFEAGVVGPEEGTKPRQVLMSEEQFEEYIDEYF